MQVGSEKIFFKYPLCITIVEYAFIVAWVVVIKDEPPYAIAYGNPAKLKGWMCQCGVKLKTENQRGYCNACGEKYFKDESGLKRG